MQGAPTTFWGKLEKDEETGAVLSWHPLLAHCADVAACAEALLTHTILGRRLATLGERRALTTVDIARLSYLAALHDIGKFNHGFQRKAHIEPAATAGHVAEVLVLFGAEHIEAARLLKALPTDDLLGWAADEAALRLLFASVAHHGRPVAIGTTGDSPNIDPKLWRPEAGRDPFAGIAQLVSLAKTWFPNAFSGVDPLPSSPAFQHGFAGLVMLADWLGSDRHDDMFPFAETLGDRMPWARKSARRAIQQLGLDVQQARATLGRSPPKFAAISHHEPRDAQVRTMELPLVSEGSLTVLESETGSGKTEAALVRYLQLFHAGLVDGMTFALPTRTAATQLHSRLVDALQRAFPDPETRPPVTLAVPGYLQFDNTKGRRLPGFEVLWNDARESRLRHRGWAAEQPKRFLAGSVVVGTIDQVLLSSLRVNHAHMRAICVSRHLLVVDEVHASDTYMNRILEEVLRFHLDAGGHAFLMSATLGSTTRSRFEHAALGRQGAAPELPIEQAVQIPYPAVHHCSRADVAPLAEVQAPGLPKTVYTALASLAADPEAVAARALEAARAGARVLVLRNTVTDAVATQVALEQLAKPADERLLFRVANLPTLHHSRFARADRILLDEAIEARFGKDAPNRGGVVAIATQTVQQSLDLDADLMLTDLAPMDVLLQRVGRVHRHRERDPQRPEGFERARLVVLVDEQPLEAHFKPDGFARGPHGLGTVYENLAIVEATRRRLESSPVLEIPGQNRELVEVTVHPAALESLCSNLGENWERHLSVVGGRQLAQQGLAQLNLIDRRQLFGDYAFRENGLAERISSRLGENDRRARFAAPNPQGPFGQVVAELPIPAWMARDIPSDPELVPTEVCVLAGPSGARIEFAMGPTRFLYDRLGLRPMP